MRCFVAVWPPAEVDEILERVPRPSDRHVRWTTPDQWHVTLAFLGEVADAHVGELSRALAERVATWDGPVVARLGPATTLLASRVLCVPVDGLDRLARWIGPAVAPFMAEPDASEPPFRGHLTLARARGRHRVDDVLVGTPVAAEWAVGRVCLVRSTRDPAGARYDTVVTAPLGRPPGGPAA